jgi:predicted  nucleic acid-binding Zn-ribbon protein
MFVCIACGYLFEDGDSIDDLPEECPVCEAGRDKYVAYDSSLEAWVKKAVAGYAMFPDEAGSDLRAADSAVSNKVRFAVVGATRKDS